LVAPAIVRKAWSADDSSLSSGVKDCERLGIASMMVI